MIIRDEHADPELDLSSEAGATGYAESSLDDRLPGWSQASVPNPVRTGSHDSEDLLNYRVFPVGESFYRERASRKGQWAVVWSDLMMTMFILFVVLYAYQAAHRQFLSKEEPGISFPGIGHDTLPVEDMAPQIYDLRRLVETDEAANLKDFASIELAPDRTVRIILTSDLVFDLGAAEIKPHAREKLVKIAELIRRSPNIVNVIGHTDNIPMHSSKFPSNWELSVSRAAAVVRFLVEDMKLPGNRFYVSGYADYLPVSPNSTAGGRAANRRVEIVITKEVPRATPGTVKDVQ
jgi:chemotaxis protein MotB